MKTTTLEVFEILRKTIKNEDDARKVVQYMEDANEAEIVKTVERKIEHLATREDLANFRAEIKSEFANHIKWMFAFLVAQLGAMFGLLHYFLK